MLDAFNSELAGTLEKVAPMKTKTRSQVKARTWMNKDIRAVNHSCRKAERTSRKTKFEEKNGHVQ